MAGRRRDDGPAGEEEEKPWVKLRRMRAEQVRKAEQAAWCFP
jgi:hypothetical protein